MAYIKQKNADVFVSNIEGYENDLESHPAMATELFEIIEGDTPSSFERLNFSTGE